MDRMDSPSVDVFKRRYVHRRKHRKRTWLEVEVERAPNVIKIVVPREPARLVNDARPRKKPIRNVSAHALAEGRLPVGPQRTRRRQAENRSPKEHRCTSQREKPR